MKRITEPATETDYPALTNVWEASVRATHHFLAEDDIQYFRPLMPFPILSMALRR
ncbi:MAG TPA: hypothetical protein VM802_07915 [Chitinophaga sp.]|uniref:hypothetical protein n=1 Tax=Chitinophaga sp. TaxID=1869181 RepID=UPI002D17B983|nr:hypothetical protein [Chitinophaga sp.]HVI44780.1 hypothetical protein [Chitinophaga sp.]